MAVASDVGHASSSALALGTNRAGGGNVSKERRRARVAELPDKAIVALARAVCGTATVAVAGFLGVALALALVSKVRRGALIAPVAREAVVALASTVAHATSVR